MESQAGRREIRKLMRDTLKTIRDFLRANLLLVLAGVILFSFIYIVFWEIPKRQLLGNINTFHSLKEYYELKNGIRTTFAQALGGAALLIGLFFTWRNLRISQEGQITDRFTKAINQLGESGPEKLAIRLGGIYALERIARDSARDHWPIMEVLTAYVRENAPWPPKTRREPSTHNSPDNGNSIDELQSRQVLSTDIQAILTVIGRRVSTHETREGEPIQRLDLHCTDLHRADLLKADLRWATLMGANLTEALLHGADLAGANFFGANLTRTFLHEVNLEGAVGLTREQIESAISDEHTRLPDYLKEPEKPDLT